MWKRDEAVRPANAGAGERRNNRNRRAPRRQRVNPLARQLAHTEKDIVHIGKSVVVKGELNGSEDLTIEGQVSVDGDITASRRGGPRNSDSLLRWDPDPGEGVWHATEETELSG